MPGFSVQRPWPRACKRAGKNRRATSSGCGASARFQPEKLIDLSVVNPDFIPEVEGDVFFDVHAGQDRIVGVGRARAWSGFLEAAALPEFVGPSFKCLDAAKLIHPFVVKPELFVEAKGDGSFDVDKGQDRIVLVAMALPLSGFLATMLPEFVGPALIFILIGNDRISSLLMGCLQARLRGQL